MRKMDEMELALSLKAIKIAWFYTVVFLFVWTLFDYIKTGSFTLALFLLISQNLVYLASLFYLKQKMVKDEK